MELVLRPAAEADKPRICEISEQIWEGDDYVAAVIDDWMDDPRAEVTVAALDGEVISFARFVWLLPGYAWFEGIRTDPQRRNTGAAKAITRYFLEKARREGAERVELSTYVENHASIHIIESHGFHRIATFVFLEALADAPVRAQAAPTSEVVAVTPEEARAFVSRSDFLRVARGQLPHGWKFYPWERAPREILGKMRDLLGIRRNGELVALLCAGTSLRRQGEFTIDFVDGPPEAVATLVRHALHMAEGCRSVELMVPATEEEAAPALEVLRALGFEAWQDYQPDVFVYELR